MVDDVSEGLRDATESVKMLKAKTQIAIIVRENEGEDGRQNLDR